MPFSTFRMSRPLARLPVAVGAVTVLGFGVAGPAYADNTDPPAPTAAPAAATATADPGTGGADPSGTPVICDAGCGEQLADLVNTYYQQLWTNFLDLIAGLAPPPAEPSQPTGEPTDNPTGQPVSQPTEPPVTDPSPTEPPADPTTKPPVTDPTTEPPTDPSTEPPAVDPRATQVLDLINTARKDAGCDPLTLDPDATAVAQSFADAQATAVVTAATLSHTAPDGTTADVRLAQVTGGTEAAAENIAVGQPDADTVVKAWLASAGHKENIDNCDYTTTGIGVADGTDGTGPYWVEEFIADPTAGKPTTDNPTDPATTDPAVTRPTSQPDPVTPPAASPAAGATTPAATAVG